MSRKRITHEVDDAVIEKNAGGRPEVAIFAKTLNRLLVEKGIHQEDLAEALGISTGSISSYRNGSKEPRLGMIVKIANFLGVDCHYLMTGVQAKNYVCSNELGLSENAIEEIKASGGWGLDVLNCFLGKRDFFRFLMEVRRLAVAKYRLQVAEADLEVRVQRLATNEDNIRVIETETGLIKTVATGYEKTVLDLTKEQLVQEYLTVEKYKDLQKSVVDTLISRPEFRKFADMANNTEVKKVVKGEVEDHGKH